MSELLKKYRIFYNQSFTLNPNDGLYINNISEELYNSLKIHYDNMYNNNGVLDFPMKETYLFYRDGDKDATIFNDCFIKILEKDRLTVTYNSAQVLDSEINSTIFTELLAYVRKLKIDSILK